LKNKKLRLFYEEQNEKLNDWLEVDTAVRSIADDIFESFDPDRDHDGIRGKPPLDFALLVLYLTLS
jgi:hypothetical protein